MHNPIAIRIPIIALTLYHYLVLIFTACAEPLGLENGHLHTDYLSGSSSKYRWNYIKLHDNNPWYSEPRRDNREYLQVVVTPYGRTVTALAVESHSFMVTSFTLKTSEDGVEWYDYIVHGNIEVSCFSKFIITVRRLKLIYLSFESHTYIEAPYVDFTTFMKLLKDIDINVMLGVVYASALKQRRSHLFQPMLVAFIFV